MHKGYTLQYFIEYFSSIPDHQWCVGNEQKRRQVSDGYGYTTEGAPTVQHCALGHAARNARTTLDRTNKRSTARMNALNEFLNSEAADINDASEKGDRYNALGKTPRGRILKALRNRQKYGHVLGKAAAAEEDAYNDWYNDEYY